MTKREQLIENYEDALFAVLMDKVAEEEGEKLREENQRLKDDPSAAVPEHVDAAARKTIREAFAGKARRSAARTIGRVLNRVAVVLFIVCLLFGVAYAAFPEVQLKTLNLLIQTSDVASKLSLVRDDGENGPSDDEVEQYILCGYSIPRPPEFSMVGKGEDKHGGWVKFEKGSGETIRISIIKNGSEYIDTENADRADEVQIHGYPGMMVEKDSRITLTWTETDQSAHITLLCINLNASFALQTAEQIHFTG